MDSPNKICGIKLIKWANKLVMFEVILSVLRFIYLVNSPLFDGSLPLSNSICFLILVVLIVPCKISFTCYLLEEYRCAVVTIVSWIAMLILLLVSAVVYGIMLNMSSAFLAIFLLISLTASIINSSLFLYLLYRIENLPEIDPEIEASDPFFIMNTKIRDIQLETLTKFSKIRRFSFLCDNFLIQTDLIFENGCEHKSEIDMAEIKKLVSKNIVPSGFDIKTKWEENRKRLNSCRKNYKMAVKLRIWTIPSFFTIRTERYNWATDRYETENTTDYGAYRRACIEGDESIIKIKKDLADKEKEIEDDWINAEFLHKKVSIFYDQLATAAVFTKLENALKNQEVAQPSIDNYNTSASCSIEPIV